MASRRSNFSGFSVVVAAPVFDTFIFCLAYS
jgi:hypothetical protein